MQMLLKGYETSWSGPVDGGAMVRVIIGADEPISLYQPGGLKELNGPVDCAPATSSWRMVAILTSSC